MDAHMTPRTAVAPDPDRVRLAPIDSRGLHIEGGMWADRRAMNRARTIPHGFHHLEASGALGNFRNAARGTGLYVGGSDDSGATFPFLDSDVYKWLEALAWELGREEDGAMRAMGEQAIALVAAAQRPDGYLGTFVQLSGRTPFSDLQWGHELYCIGHLIQAAVAWYRALGDRRLMDVAERAVARIDEEVGPGRRDGIDGHPEIEMALVELYRITGNARHLSLARHQLELRGRGLLGQGRFGAAYWQDRESVRVAAGMTGHAVRQLYLDCGVVDVAVETDDRELLDAAVRRWDDMRANRTYLTGALGSRHRDEAFGPPFELPPDRAYAETCATIASVMLAWRLLLATGEERFADAIERAMLGGVLSGMSLEGTEFFYMNPLQRRPAVPPDRAAGRRSWYPCACCPPNLMRTLSSVEQLMATVDASGIQVHQYVAGRIDATIAGQPVVVEMVTDYPWDGRIELTVTSSSRISWTLGLRVPDWCRTARLSVAGEAQPVGAVAGRVSIERTWQPGDRVVLELDMPVRITTPSPDIDAIRGCVAIERGPVVYCIEDADLPAGVPLAHVSLRTDVRPKLLSESEVRPEGRAVSVGVSIGGPASPGPWPYHSLDARSATEPEAEHREVTLLPYFAWANRGEGAMRVWIPRADLPA
jgi:DUF1680 family protein